MDTIIKKMFDEIPKFDQNNAVDTLQATCEGMLDRILTISSTTLNLEEEHLYDSVIPPLLHTIDKEVKMASNCYKRWKKSKSKSDLDDYKFLYNEAIKHIGIDISNLIN